MYMKMYVMYIWSVCVFCMYLYMLMCTFMDVYVHIDLDEVVSFYVDVNVCLCRCM